MTMQFIRAAATSVLLSAIVGGGTANATPTTFSFTGAQVWNDVATDPVLTVSGSFTVPELNHGTIVGLHCCDYPIPSAVDITVSNGSTPVYEFKDPSVFLYNSGFTAPPNPSPSVYVIDLQSIQYADNMFFGLSVFDGEITSLVLSAFDTFPFGYYHFTGVPVTQSTPAPEPISLVLFAGGFVGLRLKRAKGKSKAF